MRNKQIFLPIPIFTLLFGFSTSVTAQKDDKFLLRGKKLSDRKKFDEAVDAYKKSLEVNPNWKAAYFIGSDFLRRENPGEAIVYYRKALQYKADEPMIWYSIGYSHAKMNENAEAATALCKAVELKPDYGDAWYNLGSVLFKLERFNEAAGAYENTVRLNPKDAEAYASLGLSYENQNNFEKARNSFQKAVELAPNNSAYRQNMMRMQERLKQANPKVL